MSFICAMKAKKEAPKKAKDTHLQEEMLKIGNRIKELRIKKGFTSYEYFAYEHDFSRSQFGRYERGEDLRYSSLLKIIHAFGMTVKEFFSEGFD